MSSCDLFQRRFSHREPLLKTAAEHSEQESVPQRKADLSQKSESILPIDSLLPVLYAENVLTEYEYNQLLPTPLTLLTRNCRLMKYLAGKEPSALSRTLSILSRPEHQDYQFLREILQDIFGCKRNEEEGIHRTMNDFPQHGREHNSVEQEVNTVVITILSV